MIRKPIGNFECESGKFVVSDPCYDMNVWCRGELENIKCGVWNAEIGIMNVEKRGNRVALLSVQHESYDIDAEGDLTEHVAEFEVDVDSGQAGIFDMKYYQDGEDWYEQCCLITLSETYAGVISFGAVSSSGYGDGSYKCIYYTDTDDVVVKVIIQYI